MKSGSSKLGLGTVISIVLLLLVAILGGEDLSGLLAPAGEEPAAFPPPADTGGGAGGTAGAADWYEIYFTNPVCGEGEQAGGLDEIIAEDLLQAQVQVDLAVFELEAEPIVEALITLEERGIPVRLVLDSDYADKEERQAIVNRLRRNGLSVIEDERSAFMHNKFIVIDGRFVWVGSMNYTPSEVYCNNNNLVRFDAPALAANYQVEMDEMYNDRVFGPRSPENTQTDLVLNGVQVENHFAPETEVAPLLAAQVSAAQNEILFMAFSFTQEDIGEAVLGRAEEGVAVRGVFETVGSDTSHSYYGDMREAGLDNLQVRQDGNSRIMHHKVIILDRQTTIFGSFNFTASANDSNDENVIVIHDPVFTSFFVEEFEAIWSAARP